MSAVFWLPEEHHAYIIIVVVVISLSNSTSI